MSPDTAGQADDASSGAPSGGPTVGGHLPPEVLEQIFHLLSVTDRLSFIRVCKALKHIYDETATLQYDLHLRTSAHLDVPFELAPDSDGVNHNTGSPDSSTSSSAYTYASPSARRTSRKEAPLNPSVSSVVFRPPIRKEDAQSVFRPSLAPYSVAEKLDRLRAREQRWETLDAVVERSFSIKGPAGVYELQEGIFLMCDEYADWDDGKPTTIRLIPLPSCDDPDLTNPEVPLKAERMPFGIADLTMDPSQDLIIVSEHRPAGAGPNQTPTHRYHLLTLSSFKPHPLATLPHLDFPPFSSMMTQTRQLLQVMGDVLVILVSRYVPHWILAGLGMGVPGLANSGNEEEVVCWNWKTGKVLARMALPENGWFSSLAVLSPTTFLVTSTSNISPVMPSEPRAGASIFPPVIQLYSFLADPAHRIDPVQPLTPDYMDDTTPRPVLVAQLELPRFAPGATVATFDVRPDPAFPPRTPGKGGTASGPRIGASKPFTQDPGKGVMVFDLQVSEPAESVGAAEEQTDMVQYEMFVLRETLIRVAQEGEERLLAARRVGDGEGFERWKVEKTVKWEEWGVEGARILDASMSKRNWVCSCSGYRFISLIPSDALAEPTSEQHRLVHAPPRRSDLRMLDFSPYAVRRDAGRERAQVPLEVPQANGRAQGQVRSGKGKERDTTTPPIPSRCDSPSTLRPWDQIQDIPTSSAPAHLTKARVLDLLRHAEPHLNLTDEANLPEDAPLFEQFRLKYARMFYAASSADKGARGRERSDRADRERGRGRAGGNRDQSRSRSRSHSLGPAAVFLAGGRRDSAHAVSGRYDIGRPRRRGDLDIDMDSRHASPSPDGSRSRSRAGRSASPYDIFRQSLLPINMSGHRAGDETTFDPEDDVGDADYEVRVVMAPTVLEKRQVWKDDVVTHLPFREVWRRKEIRANGVMMDDQRVIVVCETEGRRNGDWSSIKQELTVLCM